LTSSNGTADADTVAPAPWGSNISSSAYALPPLIDTTEDWADANNSPAAAQFAAESAAPQPPSDGGDTIAVALDHYIVLGLPLTAGSHAIRRAAEARQSELPMQAGYSQV